MTKNKNYDSDFCGNLPLHHINVIQPYGFLLILDPANLKIVQVSENAAELLGEAPAEVIGQPLDKFTDTAMLKKRLESNAQGKYPFTSRFSGSDNFVLAHFKFDHLILEVEKAQLAGERSFTNVYEEVKVGMAALESAATIEELCHAAVHEVKQLTGFDGVMMYRFDEDWNGTVIAEEKSHDGLEHYMGHTFPASDIPKQARDLYLKNPYRLIPDRKFTPVKLYPVLNSATHTFIDLSDCNLRGVAGVHLEYLQNMNVQSSMSLRVIFEGKLWGLIACHHVTPHYLNFELCSVCELFSSALSNRLTAVINKQIFQTESELQGLQKLFVEEVYLRNDILAGFQKFENPIIRQLFNAGGVAVSLAGKLHTWGSTPGKEMIENLIFWLQSKGITGVFHTDRLVDLYEEAAMYTDTGSGMIAIPVNVNKGDFVLCFRPEVLQTINWGGNPNQTINFEPDGKKYHPRASFKLWQELVHQTALIWTASELRAAESLQQFLQEFTTQNPKY